MQGLEELRDAIANDLNKNNENNFKADNIIIGPGTKELMFLTQIAFQGDVLLPTQLGVISTSSNYCKNIKFIGLKQQAIQIGFQQHNN